MQRDAWYWGRARSNPPPGCLWRLWRSASTLTEPFRPDGNIFCWCHCHTFMYFTHWACAVEDLSNHDLLWIIPDPGSQKTITLYLASICTVGFQARASYVKIPAWGQHSCNLGMPYRISIFSTFWGTADQPDQNQGALLWCVADMFSNISNCEIQQPGMLIHLNNRSGESCRMHK